MVNANVQADDNVLITGIGGGVALLAAQLCIAKGANVYVTSGSGEKIKKAVELGAKGGVIYKSKEWPKELGELLKKSQKPYFDSVIDSGGGDILGQTGPLLKHGGKLVCYGMTANPKIILTMREVLRNQQLIGSTMGSRQDLVDATTFIEEKKIVPTVSHILDGLESAEQGFILLKEGTQTGKIIMRLPGATVKAKL